MPAASSRENVVVVSHDGTFKYGSSATRAVVNKNWVNSSDTNSLVNLTKFTFALKGLSFFVFGKVADKAQSEAEMALW